MGYRIRKICDGKMYSRTRTFGAKYTNRILESQDSTKGYNKQITPLSIKQSLYYGSSIVSQLHFPLSKPHCHKLQEKIIIKLEIICYTVTQHKPSVRMDCTCIDFNDSYIFLTATYIFSYHREDITTPSKPPMPNSPHFLLLFLSQQLRQNNCP